MLMIMRGTLHGRLRNHGSVGVLWSETGGLRGPSRVSGQHAEHKTTVLVKPLIFIEKRNERIGDQKGHHFHDVEEEKVKSAIREKMGKFYADFEKMRRKWPKHCVQLT